MKLSDELDFNRIQGLLQGFEWKVNRTEIKLTTLEMEVEKDRPEGGQNVSELEFDRIQGILQGFGWKTKKEETEE
ncbi:hypothetical protein LCGC14_0823800 [marine sediment metagenome]|uniref:Uncharacterized protein n=1 Tax=marine sediment metagenome TaxID=412755 RepID=A0A0F9Q3A3_9ZZZZ